MIKQVLVLRKDLNMRKGKMIAQGAHAAVLAMLQMKGSALYRKWCRSGMAKIAVSVDSLEELVSIYDRSRAKRINAVMVYDSGKTEFHGVTTETAVGLGPALSEDLDPITGGLALL